MIGMIKYFKLFHYPSRLKEWLAIYNLNGKASPWWRYLKLTKNSEERKVTWESFKKMFQEKYMSEHIFDKKIKEFHDLKMGSMTMDALINIFLELLHYVLYIRDEKVKIQQFLSFLPPYFWDKIEFDTPKNLNEAIFKDIICFEHNEHRYKNLKNSK